MIAYACYLQDTAFEQKIEVMVSSNLSFFFPFLVQIQLLEVQMTGLMILELNTLLPLSFGTQELMDFCFLLKKFGQLAQKHFLLSKRLRSMFFKICKVLYNLFHHDYIQLGHITIKRLLLYQKYFYIGEKGITTPHTLHFGIPQASFTILPHL